MCFKCGFSLPLSLSLSPSACMYFLSYDTQWRGRERIFLGERKLNPKSNENRVNKRTKKLHSCRMSTVFGGPLPPLFSHSTNYVFSFLFCFGACTSRLERCRGLSFVPSSPLLLQDFLSLHFHLLFVLYVGELFLKAVTSNLVVYVHFKIYIFLYIFLFNI